MTTIDDARAAARARAEVGTPLICDRYEPSSVPYRVRGGRMQGYLCTTCAYPPAAHPRSAKQHKAQHVPAETRIKTRSIPNVDTERLLRRLEYMRENIKRLARECEQKNDFRAHVREIVNIERELARRDVAFMPVTGGRHLLIDVHAVRETRPS